MATPKKDQVELLKRIIASKKRYMKENVEAGNISMMQATYEITLLQDALAVLSGVYGVVDTHSS